jgi:hypothetical protein
VKLNTIPVSQVTNAYSTTQINPVFLTSASPHQSSGGAGGGTVIKSPTNSIMSQSTGSALSKNLLKNSEETAVVDGVKKTIEIGSTKLAGQVASHTDLYPTTVGQFAGKAGVYLGNVIDIGKSVVYDPLKNAMNDTYNHPERSLTEDMARYYVDLSVASAKAAGKLAAPGPATTVVGVGVDTVTDTYRLQIQNAVLYNPVTDWLGGQMYKFGLY